ncbi:unnamed protein product [Amoebophrya sp. A25]|nr:unnamed protein product [Amoebophrya sp. A25]|eukprot:GSA25T00014441001.1
MVQQRKFMKPSWVQRSKATSSARVFYNHVCTKQSNLEWRSCAP